MISPRINLSLITFWIAIIKKCLEIARKFLVVLIQNCTSCFCAWGFRTSARVLSSKLSSVENEMTGSLSANGVVSPERTGNLHVQFHTNKL